MSTNNRPNPNNLDIPEMGRELADKVFPEEDQWEYNDTLAEEIEELIIGSIDLYNNQPNQRRT